MACGCESACGCNVVGDGTTAEVTRTGDTFTVSAIHPIRGVEDTDCVNLEIRPEDSFLLATLTLADAADQDASVQLRCSGDGLAGDVVIDPASSAPVSLTPDGLRIDLPSPPATAESATPGTLRTFSGVGEEAGWADADGSEVQRLAYPELLDSLSLVTMTGGRTLGSPVITNARTKYLAAGMPAEVTGFPPGMTVVSIDGPYTLTVSDNAFSTGGDSEVRVFPWGNGNGEDTFNLPLIADDEFVKQMAVGEGLGASGGETSTTIGVTNMPPHEHPGTTATDSGHVHPGSAASSSSATTTVTVAADGVHNHEPGTARDSNFVTIEDPVTAADYVAIPTVAGLTFNPGTSDATFSKTEAVSIPTHPDADAGIIDYAQGDRQFTSNDGSHAHAGTSASTSVSTATTIDVQSGSANITVDVAVEGDGTPLENRPMFRAVRWQVKL